MSYPTFHDPHLPSLESGATYELTGSEARHAVSVRRIRAGETINVVDGQGLRVRGTVQMADKSSLTMRVDHVSMEAAAQVPIILVQALAKGGRDEAAIEAATELGVDEVIAWESRRSVAKWRAEKMTKGLARWENILTSAMKQSRQSRAPKLLGFARGAEVTDLIPDGAHVLVLHETATLPLTAVDLPQEGTIAVVVGPEGGLTTDELHLLTSRPNSHAVLLGREVVRTSTAGPAAIAVLNSRTGRW